MKKILLGTGLAAVMLCMSGMAAAATVYKWTGADGTVTYGQLPPAGVDAAPVDGPPPAPSTPAGGDAVPEAADNGATPSERIEVDVDDEESMAAACEAARDNIAVLENPAVTRLLDDGGESRALEPEERDERLRENRGFVEEWC
ncbi:MAG: DUF4124 domain-containing protein [Aquisalimonadaceae bacterium]